jgi:hypothetical protein
VTVAVGDVTPRSAKVVAPSTVKYESLRDAAKHG